ncbi:hypothetical protein O181_040564 [Austropuccinia psidii MF-1]|uniref:Uncharacterized protein n=1 Tax=Austropuccinia psidii MF-1 TaxID=1389203 RepID=A0A9Q3DCP4_9BASI|nr:hypothetical protein [Austropuccinia psidii MF-1]
MVEVAVPGRRLNTALIVIKDCDWTHKVKDLHLPTPLTKPKELRCKITKSFVFRYSRGQRHQALFSCLPQDKTAMEDCKVTCDRPPGHRAIPPISVAVRNNTLCHVFGIRETNVLRAF